MEPKVNRCVLGKKPKKNKRFFSLTPIRITGKRPFMKHIHRSLRLVAAMLVIVAVISLSAVATHAPTQNQTWLTLKNIRTDKVIALYVDNHTNRGAWFCEMVLPIGAYAHNHTDRGAWFREMALPTGDNAAAENLKSVAATL
jgi:hypothetical protein